MKESSIRNIPFSPPDITNEEINEVVDTLKTGWITTGPKTKLLENRIAEYIGTNKAVCLNSATAALELVLRLFGVGPGDEVITSAYTYTASASVIEHVGAKIVLVDTKENSYEMDYEKLDAVITERTKVIIPVDFAGIVCDYEKIYEIVERHKNIFKADSNLQRQINRVLVLSDAAHAFGAERNEKKAGEIADFTCFSFHAVKNLTTAEGGAVVWKKELKLDDEAIYKEFMLLSLHGQTKDALSKTKVGGWEYDIIYPAYKCNMPDIMASIGLVQLKRYQEILTKRKKLIDQYNSKLENLKIEHLVHFDEQNNSSGHLYIIRIPNIDEYKRNEIIVKMAEQGVSCNVHFKPLPLLTAYKKLGFNISQYPNAYKQYENSISLPLHTLLVNEDITYIVEALKKSL